MTEASSIFVRLEGKDVSLSSLLLSVDQKTQKAADSALRMQAQYARLAATQGNTSQATNILTNALQNNGGASERTVVSLSQQLATVERGSSVYQQFGQSAGAAITRVIGPAAALTAGIAALNAVIGTAEAGFALKASLDADTKAIEIQLAGVRDTGVMFQQAAQYANQYKLTQQQTTEAIGAAIPVIRNSSSSMQTVLGTFDQLRVRAPTKSFQDAARALGELQAGQYTSLNKIFNIPLADARKLSDEIKKGGDAVQLVSAYLTSVGAGLDVVAARATGAAGAMKDLDIAGEQLKLALGADATGPGLLILQDRIRVTQGLTNLLRGDTAGMAQGITDVGLSLAASAAGAAAYATALASGKSAAEAQAAGNAAATAATNALTAAQVVGGGGSGTWATAQETAAAAVAVATAAVVAHTAELQTNAQAAVLAAAESTAQKAATDALTASTNADVTAFLALNPALDAAGIAALVAAGKIPPLIGQLAELRVAAYSARDAVAALAAQQAINTKSLAPGGVGTFAPGQTSGRNNDINAVAQLQAANKKAADDAVAGDLAIAKAKGQTAKEVALLRQQQQGLNKDSLAYKTIEASIITASKPKGGGGAKATKLSDQQKLNNTLLTDQEKANTQYEDLEAQHQQTLLKIQIDFAKKTLEQQKLNEVSKRQSQADFYDRLTSSDLNKKKGGTDALKQIDADYQAAYQKSQELAQAGNAKLAADYLALKSKQAADELTYQENLAKAKEEKDKAEVARLESIHKLRQDAAAEEEKQLLAGGDANVNAKNQALADEAAKNQESYDKIGTSAERTADRQTAAALRAGKAIDANNAKLDKTKSTYDQIAPSGGGSAAGTTNGSAPPDAGTATPAVAGADPISAAISALQDAISAKLDSVRSAADGTTSAVRGLAGKFAG